MNHEDLVGLQSLKHISDHSTSRGWVHHSILTYTLCVLILTMSCVALIINAKAIEQAKSGIKHHP